MTHENPLAASLAVRIQDSCAAITGRWLERIADRVSVPPRQIFPSDDLLDHMPLLIRSIASFVADPAQPVPADSAVVYHARELGALRHAQGFSEYEILKEFEILGGILFTFILDETRSQDGDTSGTAALECATRLYGAVALVQQSTTTRFLELARERVAEREGRLRAFHRALTHEMRNRIGATLGAGQLLNSLELSRDQQVDLTGVILRNADNMRLILENLLELTRLDDARQQRHVSLSSAIDESVRQLREMARDRGVTVQVASDIPQIEINAAAVELCLVNLLSNGIKYANDKAPTRWVRVSATTNAADSGVADAVTVSVEDNGIGIPKNVMARLFERFYRGSADGSGIEGTGLGLNLVREVTESLGGKAWAEQTATGSRFSFSIPYRRAMDFALNAVAVPSV